MTGASANDVDRYVGNASIEATSHSHQEGGQSMQAFRHRYAMAQAAKELCLPCGQPSVRGEVVDNRLMEICQLLRDFIKALQSGKGPDDGL